VYRGIKLDTERPPAPAGGLLGASSTWLLTRWQYDRRGAWGGFLALRIFGPDIQIHQVLAVLLVLASDNAATGHLLRGNVHAAV